MRVLVDVVEHQAGGADPALAKDLAKMTFQDNCTANGSTNGIAHMNNCTNGIPACSPGQPLKYQDVGVAIHNPDIVHYSSGFTDF